MTRLREIQVSLLDGTSAERKEFSATAAVVEAALESILEPLETKGTRKVAVALRHVHDTRYQRFMALAPDGRDGYDVDVVNLEFDLLDFQQKASADRRRTVLALLCGALRELGDLRGWDTGVIQRACVAAVEGGVSYHWRGRPKASPNRKLSACASATIDEDGAKVWISVMDNAGSVIVESPSEVLKIPHPREIRLRAHRLAWVGNTRVVLSSRPIVGTTTSAYRPLEFEFRED